jgi:hypothetical protein
VKSLRQAHTGPCGSPESWPKLGTSTLTNSTATSPYAHQRAAAPYLLARAKDAVHDVGGDGGGPSADLEEHQRCACGRHVHADRHRGAAEPGPSSVYADPTNPNHAIVTSPVTTEHARDDGHVFDVV